MHEQTNTEIFAGALLEMRYTEMTTVVDAINQANGGSRKTIDGNGLIKAARLILDDRAKTLTTTIVVQWAPRRDRACQNRVQGLLRRPAQH